MNPKIQYETTRTLLRELSIDDAKDFYTLNLDPKVIQYTGDKPFKSIDDAKIFLKNYDQYKQFGVGRLAVIEKSSNTFIGWCGLKFCLEKDEYDIGFRFYQDYWNKGFATETAKKCLEVGFEDLKLEKIVGRVMNENIASIKVLEKIGLIYTSTYNFDGQAGSIYEKRRSEF